MNPRLTGLIAAPHTPFTAEHRLALDVIPRQASRLARDGVRGAFICGTTGEGSSMTTSERRVVTEAWLAARPPGLAVIVHVGHLSVVESRELAAHAQAAGADAIASLAPSFFKPADAEALADWCAQAAAAAPRLPFYYYHMPAMTGVRLRASAFLQAAAPRIPTLAGVKFTDEDLMDFAACREFGDGRYDVLFGRDEILLAGLSLGAAGAVGSTYNFAAPLFHRIMRSFASGDLAAARADQLRAIAFIAAMNRHGGMAANKTIMKLVGLDCGPVRPPLRPLTETQETALRADLEQVGFFAHASIG